MATLGRTIPATPVRDAASAARCYRDRLGFEVVHEEAGFAVLSPDAAEVHLWQAGARAGESVSRTSKRVRSGAESFLAGTASCRIEVEGVDELYNELSSRDVLHAVSRERVGETDFGSRGFATLDADANLVTFFERVSQ
jgi:catechol 2,3-dioxygenase-like lactoylglutathione lyase family enzyme